MCGSTFPYSEKQSIELLPGSRRRPVPSSKRNRAVRDAGRLQRIPPVRGPGSLLAAAAMVLMVLALPPSAGAGRNWSTKFVQSGITGDVYAIVAHGSYVYVGGSFESPATNGAVMKNIARWEPDASTWSALGEGLDGSVRAIAVDGGSGIVYAAGDFIATGDESTTLNYVAKWDPNGGGSGAWTDLGASNFNEIHAVALDESDNLYVGRASMWNDGYYYLVKRNAVGGAWSDITDGIMGRVSALALAGDGSLYMAGSFTGIIGDPMIELNYIGRWDSGSGWSPLSEETDAPVSAMAVSGSDIVYVGGSFTTTFGRRCRRATRWSPAPTTTCPSPGPTSHRMRATHPSDWVKTSTTGTGRGST